MCIDFSSSPGQFLLYSKSLSQSHSGSASIQRHSESALNLLSLVLPSFRALFRRLQLAVRRQQFNKDSLFDRGVLRQWRDAGTLLVLPAECCREAYVPATAQLREFNGGHSRLRRDMHLRHVVDTRLARERHQVMSLRAGGGGGATCGMLSILLLRATWTPITTATE